MLGVLISCRGQHEAIRVLCAEVSQQEKQTALLHATLAAQPQAVKALLHHGALLDPAGAQLTPLALATGMG